MYHSEALHVNKIMLKLTDGTCYVSLPGFLPIALLLFPLSPAICLILTPAADIALAALFLAPPAVSFLNNIHTCHSGFWVHVLAIYTMIFMSSLLILNTSNLLISFVMIWFISSAWVYMKTTIYPLQLHWKYFGKINVYWYSWELKTCSSVFQQS